MSHIESTPAPSASPWRRSVVLLTLLALSGCVTIRYQRPGNEVTPRTGETLVFGRVRFFHDGREFFPWKVSLVGDPVATNTERHLWLLRLGRRAVSSEVHPDPDGSLAIWLGSGDYALLGSTEITTEGAPPYEVVALIRVPAGPVSAYAGDLEMRTASHEGGHLSRGEFGDATVTLAPTAIARATVEQRLGKLPEMPVVSSWCAGDRVPGFNDSKLAARAKELLDQGCAGYLALVRFLPGLRSPMLFAAGSLRVPYRQVLMFDGGAGAIELPLLIVVVRTIGTRWEDIVAALQRHQEAIAVGVLVLLVAAAGWLLRRRRRATR